MNYSMFTMSYEEKRQAQILCFALKCCKLMGKTAEQAAACLGEDVEDIAVLYDVMDEDELIDFDSPFEP